ncbi:uricase, partial [Aureobasidium melanogenum]
MSQSQLSYAKYGKDNVRLFKVRREKNGLQHITEMTVCTLLEGDIEESYTKADNSPVVATDTQKQTVYVLAKQNPVDPPELFAAILGQHFIDTYSHIHVANVKIIVHRWSRMTVDGSAHPHSFLRDGTDKRTVELVARRGQGITIKSGIDGLLVLKSTGSAFHGFHRDEYTRLPETWDRILSTEVQNSWQWKQFKNVEQVRKEQDKFNKCYEAASQITIDTFAKENSASVQATMYNMCNQILAAAPDTTDI